MIGRLLNVKLAAKHCQKILWDALNKYSCLLSDYLNILSDQVTSKVVTSDCGASKWSIQDLSLKLMGNQKRLCNLAQLINRFNETECSIYN